MAARLFGAMHTVTVCVKDDKGAPVTVASIHFNELEGPLQFRLTVDAQGCGRQEMLPDGAYEIRAEQNGLAMGMKQIVLDERKRNVAVELQYRPLPKPAPDGDRAPPMINLKMLAAGGASSGRSENRQGSLIQSVTFNVGHLDSGNPAMGKVTLAKPAPEGGVVIHLSVSNEALAEVPAEITIGKGIRGGWFPVKTSRLRGPSDVSLKVTATDGEGTQSAELPILSHTRITLQFQGDGRGLVLSSPAGMRCSGGLCSEPFREGQSVQLLPQPEPGSVFRGWSIDCDSNGVVVVTGSMNCSATFSRQ